MRLAKLSRLPLLIAILGSFSINAFAIEATTNPVGVIQVTALGDSDSLISIPLKQPAVFNGVVNSVNGKVLTAEGSPGWDAGEWVDAHYAFLRSGAGAGNYAGISVNDANSITLAVDEDIQDVAQGDSFSIHPFWTLDLLFPEGAGVNASSSHASRDSEIFVPSFGEGINLAADATYYYFDGAWRQVGGDLSSDVGGTVLLPDSYFILRNNSSSTTVTFTGEVVMGDLNLPLVASDQGEQDNIVGLQRPIEMTLDESGLGASLVNGDQLLVWDLAVAKKNRLAAHATVYTWDGAAWSGGDSGGADQVINPGRGVLIRRAQSGQLEEVDWSNSPNYGN